MEGAILNLKLNVKLNNKATDSEEKVQVKCVNDGEEILTESTMNIITPKDVIMVNSIEELIEKINNLNLDENVLYKLILIGNKNFEINTYKLLKYILNENIIKIKNKTKLKIDLEQISKENNLKGLFVKEILDELNKNNYDKNILENALEIGLNILDNK